MQSDQAPLSLSNLLWLPMAQEALKHWLWWGGAVKYWLSQWISQAALGKFLSSSVPRSPRLYMGIRVR